MKNALKINILKFHLIGTPTNSTLSLSPSSSISVCSSNGTQCQKPPPATQSAVNGNAGSSLATNPPATSLNSNTSSFSHTLLVSESSSFSHTLLVSESSSFSHTLLVSESSSFTTGTGFSSTILGSSTSGKFKLCIIK